MRLPTTPTQPDRLSLRSESYRKVIHLASALMPLLVWVLPRPASLVLLAGAAVTAVGIELARRHVRRVRYLFLRRTRRLLRGRERDGIAGATFMAVGYLLAFLIFPLPVAVAAMLYNAFGDGVAALVGKRWGRNRIPGGKSLEGAAAGILVNVATGLALPGIPLLAAVIGGTVAAVIELLPIPIDDNLSVTLGGGLALWGAVALLGGG